MTCSKQHLCEGNTPCCGWDLYNGMEIQRNDHCCVFADDVEAKAHIAECPDCQQYLGKQVITLLTEYQCFGIWPMASTVHELPPLPFDPTSEDAA